MEIELKLLIDPHDVIAFRRHALLKRFAASKPRSQQRISTYFDTPDCQLRCHRVALRIRRTGRTWMQALECGGRVIAGRHQRQEWESKLAKPYFDWTAMAALLADEPTLSRLLRDESIISCLVPVFTTNCGRTAWQLRLDQGQQVEVALDQGEVRTDQVSVPINEIALRSEEPSALFALYDFALALQKDIPLRMSNITNAQTGYALLGLPVAGPINAERFVLPPDASIEQGLQIVVGNCVAQIHGNVPGVVRSDDIECVHQMRVGLRRLRSALGTFDAVKTCAPNIQTELAWLTDQLGQARDWDVLGTSTLAALAGTGVDISGLDLLQRRAQQIARRKHQRAAAAVDSTRSARLWLLLGRWLADAGADSSGTATSTDCLSMSLMHFAEQMLRRHHRKLLARCADLKAGGQNSRHRVRIAAKKLRYTTEFFLSYYPAKPAHRFVARLAALQDAFGASNDAAVAGQLLRYLAQKYPDLSESSAYVRGYLAASAASGLGHLGKLTRRFAVLKKLRPCRWMR